MIQDIQNGEIDPIQMESLGWQTRGDGTMIRFTTIK